MIAGQGKLGTSSTCRARGKARVVVVKLRLDNKLATFLHQMRIFGFLCVSLYQCVEKIANRVGTNHVRSGALLDNKSATLQRPQLCSSLMRQPTVLQVGDVVC